MSENIDKNMNYSYYKTCKGILDGKNLRCLFLLIYATGRILEPKNTIFVFF